MRDAAEALRAVADATGDDRDHDDRRDDRECAAERRDCFGSSKELSRLGHALLEAVEVLREVAEARCCEPECHDPPECGEPSHPAQPAPMPPYPPYPPYAPYAPFPPYPPYPPVVVIGGGACGCSCQQAAMAPAATPPATAPAAPVTPSPSGAATQAAANPAAAVHVVRSASPGGFPDLTSLHDVETLLDIGESAAALVRRTLSHPPGGKGA